MFDSDLNSGFIEEDNFNIANQFSNIELIHNSKNGYSELYKAKRYGKWYALKRLTDKDDFDILKEPAGTTSFASPEQQKRNKIDNRSDIYALGKLLQDIPCQSIKIKIITRKCLAENPERRFSSALDVKKKLNDKTNVIAGISLLMTTVFVIFSFILIKAIFMIYSIILMNLKNDIVTSGRESRNNEIVLQESYDSLKREVLMLDTKIT